MTRGVRRGCIRLKGAIVGIDDEDETTFTVTVDMKVFHLQARDAEEREKWIRGLEDTILRHAQLQRVYSFIYLSLLLYFKIELQSFFFYFRDWIPIILLLQCKTLTKN